MKFIKLTRTYRGVSIFIAVDKIESIQPTSNYKDNSNSSIVCCIGDSEYEVIETVKDILLMIEVVENAT